MWQEKDGTESIAGLGILQNSFQGSDSDRETRRSATLRCGTIPFQGMRAEWGKPICERFRHTHVFTLSLAGGSDYQVRGGSDGLQVVCFLISTWHAAAPSGRLPDNLFGST
ncbi:hypothetical protein Pan181_02570 [Aeoliella mucimassa]|uniref:Uncharacterized protein n=1 Tax=Aeoliella mucimassa TaxID=2527972 RepID=A0A518AH79_9BACT|nr:hypothetical protein Pan181_02570 [Aeoliella mucimassa]